jgi:hypothetical protein
MSQQLDVAVFRQPANEQRLTTVFKERLQQFRATTGQHAEGDFHLVVQLPVVYHLQDGMHCTRFWIVSAIHQALDPRVKQRPSAHSARLNCNKQFAAFQTIVTNVRTGLAEGDDFGVGGGIGIGDAAVEAAAYDASLADDDGADWDLARFQSALGGAEGFFHPELIGRRLRLMWVAHFVGSAGCR